MQRDQAADQEEQGRDIDWFRDQLQERGVSRFEIVWGNYVEYFHQVPRHALNRYLHHRGSMLHKKALELALMEEEAMENHPFAC